MLNASLSRVNIRRALTNVHISLFCPVFDTAVSDMLGLCQIQQAESSFSEGHCAANKNEMFSSSAVRVTI